MNTGTWQCHCGAINTATAQCGHCGQINHAIKAGLSAGGGQLDPLVRWLFPSDATGWAFCAQAFACYFAFGTFWHGLSVGIWIACVLRNITEEPPNAKLNDSGPVGGGN